MTYSSPKRKSLTKLFSLLPVLCMSLTGFAQAPDATERAIRVLEALDKNRDGRLDPDEIPARSRVAVERAAQEAGLKTGKPLSLEKLKKQLEKERKKAERRSGKSESKQESVTTPKATSTKPTAFGSSRSKSSTRGFGGKNSDAALRGKYDTKVISYVSSMFRTADKNGNGYLDKDEWSSIRTKEDPKSWDANRDGRLTKEEVCAKVASRTSGGSSKSTKTSTSSSSRSSSNSNDKYQRYAASLLRRYDANRSGVLEKDEWGRLRGDPKEYDRNRDGVLNVDEIASKLRGYTSSSKSSSKSKTTAKTTNSNRRERTDWRSRRSTEKKESKEEDSRPSYRFLTAHERLPSGLDDWFTEKDQDADGQVTMSEFASSWNATKVEEFTKLDANNDGIITAQEALAE